MEVDKTPVGASVTRTGNWTNDPFDMMSQECNNGDALVIDGSTTGTVTFTPNLPKAGNYRLFVGFTAGENNSPKATVRVKALHGTQEVTLDQSAEPNRWHYLGTYPFAVGTGGTISLSNEKSALTEVVKADCVKLQYDGPVAPPPTQWRVY